MSNSKLAAMQPLLTFIKTVYPISSEIEDYFADNCDFLKVKRGTFLLKPGEICNHYYFIVKGMLRAYNVHGNKEITTWFNAENELVTSIRSMSRQMPSMEYIQALEDTEMVTLDWQALNHLYEKYVEMNIVGRIIIQEYYAAAEERAYIGRIPNAEMRYRHFIESRRDLVNRVPLKFIASYLGMTEETLSRLRGKKVF